MSEQERMQQRHHDGMCGGACPECFNDQAEDEARREAERQPEPTTEELCDPHPYHGDDTQGGRCYCGQKRYAVGGAELPA